VTDDGVPVRVEVRVRELLEEVHELDDQGRVVRSLYRTPRDGVVVEWRVDRDETGGVVRMTGFDRTGDPVE
jgi:hypothetical protein